MKQSIIEYEIGKVVSVINNHAFLARLKTKSFTQFKHKLLKMDYKIVFKVIFREIFSSIKSEKF